MMTRKSSFIALVCLVTLLGLVSLAGAANEVFLSTDTAQSEVTYIIQFEAGVKGHIDTIRITLPPDTNAANGRLGRLIIGDKVFEDDEDDKKDVTLSVDPLDPNTLIVDLRDDRNVKPGTKILVELFNLNNPVAGNYVIDVSTIGKKGNVLEVIPSIAYSTFATGTGDITAVNTPAGSGLTGGAASGDVNLSLQLCAAGQVLKSLGASWGCAADNDTNSGGTVTSVGTGSGLTGGPITTTGTVAIATGGVTSAHIADGSIGSVDVNSAQIQLRIGSSCAAGSSIRVINADGTVTCEADDNSGGTVTAVTASAPLASSGGTTPNISLPNVIIQNVNPFNTAIGSVALSSNTTGTNNTASGVGALLFNTTGSNNTAIGFGANVCVGCDNLTNATAIGANAVVDASNKIRLGDANVTVIEGQVAFTASSDKTKKENFQPVDGEEVLRKLRGFTLTSWNFIGHDPEKFRHYGPMAQDFFAAFGNDGVGTIGTPTTINSGDMAGILMIAVQALEKQNREIKAENAELKARLERLEGRMGGYVALTKTE